MHNPLLPNIMFYLLLHQNVQVLRRNPKTSQTYPVLYKHYSLQNNNQLQISRDNKIIKNSCQIVQTYMFNFTSKISAQTLTVLKRRDFRTTTHCVVVTVNKNNAFVI